MLLFSFVVLTLAAQVEGDEDVWPAIRPIEFDAEHSDRLFPARISNVTIGGRGRFLIARMPRLLSVAIFDVNSLKIEKYLRVGNSDAIVVANLEDLFVIDPLSRQIQRILTQNIRAYCSGDRSRER